MTSQTDVIGKYQGQQAQQKKSIILSLTIMIHKRIYHPSSSYLMVTLIIHQGCFQPRPQQPYYSRPQPIFWNQGTSLEDLVKSLAVSSLKFGQEFVDTSQAI